MLLSRLQELIGGIYDVRVAYDVYDFLVTDRGRLPQAPHAGIADEELIVAQSADGAEVALSLYLATTFTFQNASEWSEAHLGWVYRLIARMRTRRDRRVLIAAAKRIATRVATRVAM